MDMKKVLKDTDVLPDEELIQALKLKAKQITSAVAAEIKKQKISASIFIGGSFAKGTLVKKDEHDIDIFVRFDWRYENISGELEKIVKKVAKRLKLHYEKMHGSRDYFRIKLKNIIFEIIPVLDIKNPREARNVTDLSYFHVNYVKKRINKRIAREIVLAKTFCRAQGVYGAESYIQGFSGYGLECLIIYYKNFEKMLKELSKTRERIILDPENRYKNKNDVIINLNESKLRSPVILVDPTWKERNVLAALSNESFNKFREAAIKFLRNPSAEFFRESKTDISVLKKEAKRKKAELLHLKIRTDKQAGDIAGTKLKKFSRFVSLEFETYFTIINSEFIYNNKQEAELYLILKSKGKIVKIGPPIKIKDACSAFKKSNKNTFEKNGMLHTKIKINYSAKRFLLNWIKKYAKKVKEMDITGVSLR